MRVAQANGLHGAKTKGIASPFGHDFYGQTAIKIASGFPFVKFGFIRLCQSIDKGVILGLSHRTVEIGCALLFCFTFVITGLHPSLAHINAVKIDDWGNGIKEGQ